MNTSRNQNNVTSNLVSFAGTVLAASYLPVFIYPTDQREQGTVTLSNGLTVDAKYYNSTTVELNAPIIGKSFWKLVFQYIKSLISSFTRKQKLKEIRAEFNEFIAKSKKNFECYKKLHESALEDMVNDIDIINRQKTLMKDYLLQKLFKKLQEMGIETSFSDFTVEHIDLRDFPINDNFDLVKCENLSSINEAKSSLDYIISFVNKINPYYYLFSRFYNTWEINEIENRLKELEKKESYNTTLMNSDMALLGELECALRNISCIYKDVMDTLMPIMEKLLAEGENQVSDLMWRALNYLHDFWDNLFAYRKDGEYAISNCAAEQAIRPQTVQRKNSLFYCSTKGAVNSAIYNTFIETCKQAGISFREYFRRVILELKHGRTDYANLLPMTIGLKRY